MRECEYRCSAGRNTKSRAAQASDPGTAPELPLQPIGVQDARPIRAAIAGPAARFEVINGVIDTRM